MKKYLIAAAFSVIFVSSILIIVSQNSSNITGLEPEPFPPVEILPTTASAKQISLVPSNNAGGQYLGYIKKAYTKNGKNYIDIDYIVWIDDPSMPNNFRIQNDNPLIRTFEVSPNAKITLLSATDPAVSFPGDFEVFTLLDDPNFEYARWYSGAPYTITLDGDIITEITMRYTP